MDGGPTSNVVLPPASCDGLAEDCGPSGATSCCTSLHVIGGTFKRSYDAVTYTDPGFPATVRDFYLDEFEVTVGRFRRFVDAWVHGWRPSRGSGKHTRLPRGGLSLTSGDFEPGWDPAAERVMATNSEEWAANLSCGMGHGNWSTAPDANERQPVQCTSWFDAYAFCIWDGGFLPSEAEWNYAASGGSEQRVYPWSKPATSTMIDCAHANYTSDDKSTRCASGSLTRDVGAGSSEGIGKYGQMDLAGNVLEWNYDVLAIPYAVAECVDCANDVFQSADTASRVVRGGAYDTGGRNQLASFRSGYPATTREPFLGFRCARGRIANPTARDVCEEIADALAGSRNRCQRISYAEARQTWEDALQCSFTRTYDATRVNSCVSGLDQLDCNLVLAGILPASCAGALSP